MKTLWVGLCTLLLSIFPAFAKDNRVQQAVDSELHVFLADKRFSAVSVGLYLNGERHQFHYGALPSGSLPDSNTRYEIGSITKTYTGLLLAQAVVDGKLRLDDDIRGYLGKDSYPNLMKAEKPIAFRHLASHTSGLPKDLAYTDDDVKNGLLMARLNGYAREAFFRDLHRVTLVSVPGETYAYSNTGANLIAYILEGIYQAGYPSLLEKHIFARTGEKATEWSFDEEAARRVVIGRNERSEAMPLLRSQLPGAGGLTATTSAMLDYLAFNAAAEHPVLQQAQQLIAGNRAGNGRAFFWNTFNYETASPMLYHSGGTLGTSSWMALYPKQKMGVFIVTNTYTPDSQGKLNETSNRIVAALGRL
jgi:serine-type D-Ala-D-Ala carboxypeptidase/endopeptidase